MRNFIKVNQSNTSNGSKRIAFFEDSDFRRCIEIEQNGKVYTNIIFQDGQTLMVTDRAESILAQLNGQKPTETKQNTSNVKK